MKKNFFKHYYITFLLVNIYAFWTYLSPYADPRVKNKFSIFFENWSNFTFEEIQQKNLPI